MIRQVLFALGLSAGAAHADGMVQAAPILEACGGTRLVLEDVTLIDGSHDPDDMAMVDGIINARIAARYGAGVQYSQVEDGQIIVSIPSVTDVDFETMPQLFERLRFGFYHVVRAVNQDAAVTMGEGQFVLPLKDEPDRRYLLEGQPIVDASGLVDAQPSFDQNNLPAMTFRFGDAAGQAFGDYTNDNIGRPFAIVLGDEVLSAPTIRAAIYGGSGIITGNFTVEETNELAVSLRSGVMPFDMFLVFQETMDGSDPSADFCP